MRARLFLFAIILCVTSPASALPPLSVVGNHLEAEGKPITLRGVSLCGLGWQDTKKDIADASHGWNSNIIRIPVQPKEWRRAGVKNFLKDFLDPAVAACKANNVYCIIDWHEIRPWQPADTNRELEAFWRIVAPRYASNPHILYEFFNEPMGPAERTRENWLRWLKTAQIWVDAIRAVAPETVILVGSPHWSQMPDFAVADPFSGKNLVYVMHLYPGWSVDTWDKFIGEPSRSLPLLLSEWGWSSREESAKTPFAGTKDAFGIPLKAYLDARPNISWTAWSYHDKCGPAMLGVDKEMGDFVKEWLKAKPNAKP